MVAVTRGGYMQVGYACRYSLCFQFGGYDGVSLPAVRYGIDEVLWVLHTEPLHTRHLKVVLVVGMVSARRIRLAIQHLM